MSRSSPNPNLTILARLDAGMAYRLVLIIAPHGAGKTRFLHSWVRHRMENGSPAPAWVSLGEPDNSLDFFLQHLITAFIEIEPCLERVLRPKKPVGELSADPSIGQTSSKIEPIDPDDLLIELINSLSGLPGDCTLILDEYHLIESPEVHQAFSFLLEYLPKNVHIYMATRYEPPLRIAHLRARRELIEIGPASLVDSLE